MDIVSLAHTSSVTVIVFPVGGRWVRIRVRVGGKVRIFRVRIFRVRISFWFGFRIRVCRQKQEQPLVGHIVSLAHTSSVTVMVACSPTSFGGDRLRHVQRVVVQTHVPSSCMNTYAHAHTRTNTVQEHTSTTTRTGARAPMRRSEFEQRVMVQSHVPSVYMSTRTHTSMRRSQFGHTNTSTHTHAHTYSRTHARTHTVHKHGSTSTRTRAYAGTQVCAVANSSKGSWSKHMCPHRA